MNNPFIIFALPRSRTAWLTKFLSYEDRRVGHDMATECGCIADFANNMIHLDGTVETGAMLGWRLIKRMLPSATLVVVKRPLEEVRRSLKKFGLSFPAGELENRAGMLDALSAAPRVRTISFSDLNDPSCCEWLFQHCLETRFDSQWYEHWRHLNVQIDLEAQLSHLHWNHARLEAFKKEVLVESSKIGGDSCLGLN